MGRPSKNEKNAMSALDAILTPQPHVEKTFQVKDGGPIVSETETTQTVLDVNNQEVVVKKRKEPTSPWRPANRIAVKAKNPKAFRIRGINKSVRNGERVEKALAEGWEFCRKEDLEMGGRPSRGLDDGSGNGNGEISIGDLIYMKMPEEMGKQRDKYHEDLNAFRNNSSVNEYLTSTKGAGRGGREDRKVTIGLPDGTSRYVPSE